ncbi:unnamed protein product [Heterobilharzia americana]|nr:unnamed protein product [Heterobilharzia americana]
MTAVYLVLGTTLVTVLVRSFREIIDYEFTNVTCTLEETTKMNLKAQAQRDTLKTLWFPHLIPLIDKFV